MNEEYWLEERRRLELKYSPRKAALQAELEALKKCEANERSLILNLFAHQLEHWGSRHENR